MAIIYSRKANRTYGVVKKKINLFRSNVQGKYFVDKEFLRWKKKETVNTDILKTLQS